MKQAPTNQERKGFFIFLNLYRWVNWALALLLLYLGATPETPLATIIATYGSALVYNALFTIWPGRIEALLRRRPYLIAIDCLFCAFLIFVYGWGSPFYVYSFSPVMLAGYLFSLRGSFLVAALGAIGYHISISVNGLPWAEIVEMGEVDTHLFQMFDYFLVAIFFSYPAVLAESLRRANGELRETRAKIERLVLAQERQRIAADMHDGVTQSLLGVNLLIDASLQKNKNPKLDRELHLAKEAAARAMSDMREAVDDLFREKLDRLTAKEIIGQALEEARETYGLDAKLSANGAEGELTPDVKKALYLIVQETITNVIKHAKASSVSVGLAFTGGSLELEVIDDGCGFDCSGEKTGNGLKTISRRLAELRGTVEISSSPRNGTRIEARIPL